MSGDVAFQLSSLLGPYGGLISVGFGAGCAAGYSFAHRTTIKMVRKQQEECDRRVTHLENKVEDLLERERHGLLRQLDHARQSTEQMVGRIEKGRLRPLDE